MTDERQTPVTEALEPGEQLIWTGRPQVELAVAGRRRFRQAAQLAGMAFLLVLVYWLVPESSKIRQQIQALETSTLLPIVGIFVLVTLLVTLGPNIQLKRYFRRLSYAITNRRLLIFEGDRISDSYTPERVSTPFLKERHRGRADVIFGKRSSTTRDRRSVVNRERDEVGFKALSNAGEVLAIIEKWLADNLNTAEKAVTADLEAPSVHTDSQTDYSSGCRRIENQKTGLSLEVPLSWSAKVRIKKKPIGSFFFDKENWQAPEAAQDWNVVLVEGPAKCKIEIEIFETAPTLTFKELNSSRMADALAGKVVASEPDIAINGIRGFSVTRRTDVAVDRETGAASVAAIAAPERRTVLHDGRRQIYILSSWPEDSRTLEKAVDAVVRSIRLE